jgi:hypothetical protein
MENSVNALATFILRDALDSNSSSTLLKSSRLPVSSVSLKNPWRIRIARAISDVVVGADLGSGFHASYEASSTNRAVAVFLSISYNVVGEGGTGRSEHLPSTMGLAGRNGGDTGGGCDYPASALFKMWKLPSGDERRISSTLAPPMSMASYPCTADSPLM